MSVETEVANVAASTSGGMIAAIIGGLGAGGYALMTIVRQYSATRKESAADNSVTTAYGMLTSENKRLADHMTALSLLVNANLSEKLQLLTRVGELERKLTAMGDMEQENRELRAEIAEMRGENHALRESVRQLQLAMGATK